MNADGEFTERMKVIKAADMARLSEGDWRKERDKMIHTCNQCHSNAFSTAQLKQGDEMIKQTDHLMAEALRLVGALYEEGIIEKPADQEDIYPDLLTSHDISDSPIEQQLFNIVSQASYEGHSRSISQQCRLRPLAGLGRDGARPDPD